MSRPPIAREPPHDVEVTAELARALLRAQHRDLADLPIRPVETGWDNVMLRLGEALALRMPRRAAAAGLALNEQRWMPLVAKGLPLPAPIPVRVGVAGLGYPYLWSVVPWFEGTPADLEWPSMAEGEALAGFLRALHRPAPDDAPANPYRGVPLGERAAVFEDRMSLIASPDLRRALRQTWAAALAQPMDTARVWFHGDLHGRNVLVKDGRLAAVIDWGDMAAGDPACDLAAVWMLLPHRSARERAIAAYPASAAAWTRARGWAALMASFLLPLGDNPRMAAMGLAIAERLEEGP